MATVSKLESHADITLDPSWSDVEHRVRELADLGDPDRSVSLGDGEDTFWLVVYFVPSHGYHVSGVGIGENEYYTVVDERTSQEVVEVWMAGDEAGYLRFAFVPQQVMLTAVREFFESGRRSAAVAWELAEDVMSWE